MTTYYDRPVLKEPVWIWSVPAYFWTGGVAGAAAVLGAVAHSLGGRRHRRLVRRTRWATASGIAAGTVLLVIDLGRPERFLNMLRVVRPTSPMSVGSWVLAASGGAAAGGLLPGRLGDASGLAAGALGVPLSGYTAVLLTTTAVPLWQAGATTLPALFVASAANGAAGVLALGDLDDGDRAVVRRYGLAGAAGEIAAAEAFERRAREIEAVGRALDTGVGGALWRAGKAASAVSLLLWLSPRAGRLAGAGAAVSSLAVKLGVFYAGRASARDPRATFDRQRA